MVLHRLLSYMLHLFLFRLMGRPLHLNHRRTLVAELHLLRLLRLLHLHQSGKQEV
jgi:hypothetical protein